MVRLRKAPETVMKVFDEAPRTEPEGEGALHVMGMTTVALDGDAPLEESEAVECNVWVDLDGNPCAWSPVGSGVIAIEIGEKDEDAPVDIYQALRDAQRANKSAEERIAELEQMVARLAAAMVE
jgi:hypothetical protein